jgi:mannose-6-phosphate isomerase-like protein (cupin superfamily)
VSFDTGCLLRSLMEISRAVGCGNFAFRLTVCKSPSIRARADSASRAGSRAENPVTGERAVVRQGSEDTDRDRAVVDLYVAPGGAVTGEHVHPVTEKSFTVVRGRVGFRIAGREKTPELNQRQTVPPRVVHDWWNAGDEEAHVIVEYNHGAFRFEDMIGNLFGLARDGKTNPKGIPNPLQGALFACEFRDVIYFTSPPIAVQRLLYPVLAIIGRALGYKGSYPRYSAPQPPSAEALGPPSSRRVVEGVFAVAASVALASVALLRTIRPPTFRR